MRIACPIIASNTGSDVYYQVLSSAMTHFEIQIDIFPVSYINEFMPFINKKLLNKLKEYDIIHTNIDYASLFAIPGIPLITTCHHNVFEIEYQQMTSFIQKIYHQGVLKPRIQKALNIATKIISVSQTTDISFKNSFPSFHSDVILNGIDTHLFKPLRGIKRESNHIILVGTLSSRKGDNFLNSLVDLLPKKIKLTIVTRFLPRKTIDKRIDLVLNPSNIELVELYNKASILISLSKIEGFGYTLAEGMACGCAIVAWDHSAIKEVCKQDESGVLVSPYDIEEFSKSIISLCEDNERLKAASGDNIQRVQQEYSISRMAQQYYALYSSIHRTNKLGLKDD